MKGKQMEKRYFNSGKTWTKSDEQLLLNRFAEGLPIYELSTTLGRTEYALICKLNQLDVNIKYLLSVTGVEAPDYGIVRCSCDGDIYLGDDYLNTLSKKSCEVLFTKPVKRDKLRVLSHPVFLRNAKKIKHHVYHEHNYIGLEEAIDDYNDLVERIKKEITDEKFTFQCNVNIDELEDYLDIRSYKQRINNSIKDIILNSSCISEGALVLLPILYSRPWLPCKGDTFSRRSSRRGGHQRISSR
jgi:hypothetical protein